MDEMLIPFVYLKPR